MFRIRTLLRGYNSQLSTLKGLSKYRLLATSSTSEKIVHSPVPDIDYPRGNFIHHIFQDVQKWADKRAVECSVSGRYMTYSQLQDFTARWGGYLKRVGISQGDVVAIIAPNCPQYLPVLYGCMAIGVTLTPINGTFTPTEIGNQIGDSNPKLIVCWPTLEGSVREAMKITRQQMTVVTIGPGSSDAINLDEVLQDENIPFADPVELSGEEIMIMPYSSGTTGKPKGTALSHNAFNSNLTSFKNPYNSLVPETTADHQECYMMLLPVYHIAGLMLKLFAINKGIKLLSVPTFNPSTFIDTIIKHHIRILHLVPTLLNFLVNHPNVNKTTLGHLLTVGVGAAPVHPSTVYALKDKLGTSFIFQEVYGMTELIVSLMSPINEERVGMSGILLANLKGKVIDVSTGELLPPNTKGEICILSPSRMSYYLNNPTATAETLDSDGWIHTGDIGLYDDDGFFKIVDRTKDLIKVKAMQVAPSELEDIILQHPNVIEVAVIGVPDDRLGEAPRAYIVARKEMKAEEIHKFLEPLVSQHKQISGGVIFMDQLPKGGTGKVLKRELRDLASS